MKHLITQIFLTLAMLASSCGQNASKGYSSSVETVDIGKLFVDGINSESEQTQKELVPMVFSKALMDAKGVDAMQQLFSKLHSTYYPLVYHHSEIKQRDKSMGGEKLIHVYARKQGERMYQDFQMLLDDSNPSKINKLIFIAEVTEPINLPNGAIQQKQTLEWLDEYIMKLVKENDLSGNILIAEGESILYEKGFGYADVSRKIPLSSSSLFSMASGGKMFTALTIAKLVEENKINYSDKITKYIDGFKDKNKAEKITIHHLLSHTSGVAQYWWGQESEAFKKAKTINDHLKMVLEVGLKTEAGTEYEYNNSNFILLGAIIEKVTGKDYFTEVQEKVLQPSQMKETGYFEKGTRVVVTPFIRSAADNTKWEVVPKGNGKGSSAGGSCTNAKDMLKFSRALRNNQIVSKETFSNLVVPHNIGVGTITEQYGYGFILEKYDRELSYGHGGTSKGVNFEFRYFPSLDITLVIFSNQDNGAYDDLKRNATKLITGAR